MDNRALVPAPAAVASVGSSHGPPRPAPIAMTVASAMSALGIGKTKLYELLASGDLEAIRVGRRRLILQASIEALVERLREGRLAERE